MKQKIIMFGDYTMPDWHPLGNVEPYIKKVFSETGEIIFTEDRSKLDMEYLKGFDCIILYLDRWKERLSSSQSAGLLCYVAQGGRLLILHNGISIQSNHELAQMAGGRFLGHPQRRNITIKPVNNLEHPILEGIGNITLFEEPYTYDFDNYAERTVLMSYSLNSKEFPALWTVSYCLGKIVWLMPGHDESTFADEGFRGLLRNCVNWLCC